MPDQVWYKLFALNFDFLLERLMLFYVDLALSVTIQIIVSARFPNLSFALCVAVSEISRTVMLLYPKSSK